MALILNIETSTDICSVALADGERVCAHEMTTEPFQHASQLTVLIDRCIRNASQTYDHLDAIAVSEGPGSFTGLRVGFAAAKGLCFALDIPLLLIPTLQALAAGAQMQRPNDDNVRYHAMIDARRMEVYSAVYDGDLKEIQDAKAQIITDSWLDHDPLRGLNTVFVGNGAQKLGQFELFQGLEIVNQQCSALYMVKLAFVRYQKKDYSRPESAAPKYLKPPNITKPRKVI